MRKGVSLSSPNSDVTRQLEHAPDLYIHHLITKTSHQKHRCIGSGARDPCLEVKLRDSSRVCSLLRVFWSSLKWEDSLSRIQDRWQHQWRVVSCSLGWAMEAARYWWSWCLGAQDSLKSTSWRYERNEPPIKVDYHIANDGHKNKYLTSQPVTTHYNSRFPNGLFHTAHFGCEPPSPSRSSSSSTKSH